MTTDDQPSSHPAVLAFEQELRAALREHAKALYATRSLELQRSAAEAFGALEETAMRLKRDAVADSDEDAAARLLMGECLADGLRSRLRLWIAFREGDMDAAWESLISAQNAFDAVIRAHPSGSEFRQFSAEMQAVEALVFPEQLFVSTGWITERSHCSICEQPFGTCEHIAGRVYAGQFAARVVSQAKPTEVSWVAAPDDKRCRAFTVSDADGVNRNVLTWEPTPDES